mmetsp:Transcript_5711/g.12694  ORF Transcript_5711/g.12694 Transcript_5711/m.12694 type:complete len:160 (-) Transcript_5711:427-906(-)
MLPCGHDTCHAVFHIACLNPPLQAVPPGEWLCPCCKILPLMPQPPDLPPPPPFGAPHGLQIPQPPDLHPPPQSAPPPKKRSAPPLPHEYCSHCWVLGSHWNTECPDKDNDPLPRPENFLTLLKDARNIWKATKRSEKTSLGIHNPSPSVRKGNKKRFQK